MHRTGCTHSRTSRDHSSLLVPPRTSLWALWQAEPLTREQLLEQGFVGSPSSFAKSTWSAPSNMHIHNHQVHAPQSWASTADVVSLWWHHTGWWLS